MIKKNKHYLTASVLTFICLLLSDWEFRASNLRKLTLKFIMKKKTYKTYLLVVNLVDIVTTLFPTFTGPARL